MSLTSFRFLGERLFLRYSVWRERKEALEFFYPPSEGEEEEARTIVVKPTTKTQEVSSLNLLRICKKYCC